MTIADKLKRKPLAIGRPFVIESASCIVPCRTVCHLTYFFGFQVEYHQPVTVFDKSQFFTIRRVLRVSTFYGFGGEQYFLFNKSGVREIRLFFTSYLSGIKLPVAGPLAGINQCTVVGSKRYTGFLCRSICYLLGCSIIGWSYKNITSHNKSHLLTIRRHRSRSRTLRKSESSNLFFIITHKINIYFLRAGIGLLCIKFSVIRIA